GAGSGRAAVQPVRVSPEVFMLLERALRFSELTGGTFDVTIAPLVRCWGFMKGSGSRPTDEQIAEAREAVGFHLLELDEAKSTVRFKRDGMMLDLGSIGKGYGLDLAAEVLRDAGVENGLLHGGTSTIYALGLDVSGEWKVAIDKPILLETSETDSPDKSPLAVVELSNEALSVSAVSGKFFTLDGKTYGHVLDPRTGWPAQSALLGAVVTKSAADSDALSTAVLLGNDSDLQNLQRDIPGIRFLQTRLDNERNLRSQGTGIELLRDQTPKQH
ncbi:MAG: FAD:protein FMN transferase, partial [Limisphaerales bacterium]